MTAREMPAFAGSIALEKDRNARRRWAIAAGVLALTVLCFVRLGISLPDLLFSLPQFLLFFVRRFLPPDFSGAAAYVPTVLQTLAFTVVSTAISTLLSFLLGILMSENTNPAAPLRAAARGFVSFLRNVPVIIWASLFVYMFGIGSLIGLFALVTVSVGFLARSYAESIDAISGKKLEALRAAGASFPQLLFHGIIPQFVPAWINWTLYIFELNVRASVILGFVGAGGVGVLLQTKISLMKYQQGFALLLIVVALVLLTEFGTGAIRKRVR